MTGCPTSDYWALPSRGYYLPRFSRRSGFVHCRRSGPVEGVGGFEPSTHAPEHPPLFPPLVPSTRGKVVSTALGAPPPEINADSIGQSLTMDQDEESILSDSYSDRHSATADSSIMWGRQLRCIVRNRNHGPRSAGIKTATGLVTRTTIGIAIGNVTGPKRETSSMVQNSPANALHDAKTTMVSAAVLTSTNVRMDMRALSMTAKQSKGAGPVPVHRMQPQEVTHPQTSTSAASTHVAFNTFSRTS